MWESWVRNKVVAAVALFTGFEAAAWFVSKLAPAHAFTAFFGASVFAVTMLGVYLLVSRRTAPSGAGAAPASAESGIARGWSHVANGPMFPDLQVGDLTANSVCLILNHEPSEAQNERSEPFFRDGLAPIRLGDRASSVPWATLSSVIHPDGFRSTKFIVEASLSRETRLERLKRIRKAIELPVWRLAWERFSFFVLPLRKRELPEPRLRGVMILCSLARMVSKDGLALADEWSEELRLVGSVFGVHFPVNILVTQADRIVYFREFMTNLKEEERQQAAGVIFPAASGPLIDVSQIKACLNDWFGRLAKYRVDLLHREEDVSSKPRIYEHPREWSKLISPLAGLIGRIVPAVRPTAVGPVLRAISFTGEIPRSFMQSVAFTNFLGTDVKENIFLAGAANNALVNDLARAYFPNRSPKAALVTFFALLLVILAGSAHSWALNQNMLDETRQAVTANGLPNQPVDPASTRQALESLDQLRQTINNIETGDYRKRWQMRWGLYQGDEVDATARGAYFSRLRTVMIGPIRDALSQELSNLGSSSSTTSADAVRKHLRLYLTVSERQECRPDPLFPAELLAVWKALRPNDQSEQLAFEQLEFYSMELRAKRLYRFHPDETVIDSVSDYLRRPQNPESLFNSVVDGINHSKNATGARLTDVLTDAKERSKLESDYKRLMSGPIPEMEPAYSRSQLSVARSFFLGANAPILQDACMSVMGSSARPPASGDSNAAQISYVAAYLDHWKKLLIGTHVNRFSSIPDAATRLEDLTDNQSPLLAIFAFVSNNTGKLSSDKPESDGIDQIDQQFQPIHYVIPTDSHEWKKTVDSKDSPYIAALHSLADRMRDLDRNGNDPTSKKLALNAADDAARAADRIVSQIQYHFDKGTTDVGTEVTRLLGEPIAWSRLFLKDSDPAAGARQAIGKFCAQLFTISQRFPFDPTAHAIANDSDLRRIFDPGGSLAGDLVKQGAVVITKEGAWTSGANLPNSNYATVLKRAGDLSQDLFGQKREAVTIDVQPPTGEKVEITVGGVTRSDGKFDWPGQNPQAGAVVSVRPGTMTYPWMLGAYELKYKADRTSKPGFVILRKADLTGDSTLEIKSLSVSGLPDLSNLTCPSVNVRK